MNNFKYIPTFEEYLKLLNNPSLYVDSQCEAFNNYIHGNYIDTSDEYFKLNLINQFNIFKYKPSFAYHVCELKNQQQQLMIKEIAKFFNEENIDLVLNFLKESNIINIIYKQENSVFFASTSRFIILDYAAFNYMVQNSASIDIQHYLIESYVYNALKSNIKINKYYRIDYIDRDEEDFEIDFIVTGYYNYHITFDYNAKKWESFYEPYIITERKE